MKLVLLHSPLTGPATWRQLAPLLQVRGHDVRVPDYRSALSGPPPYYDQIARSIERQAGEPSVLIVHSGAGALVPVLASILPLHVAIFVDALLPHPGRAWLDTVTPEMHERVRGFAREGKLPRWVDWWPEGAIAAMVRNSALYAQFADELTVLPLAYFQEKAPSVDIPPSLACGYLQLSLGYDSEAIEAERRGWPLRRLALHHLATMTDYEPVADQLCDLLNTCA